MDVKWKRLLVGAGATVGITALLTRWPAINDVITGETPEYPDLQPWTYPIDADRVFLATQEVGHGMPGWKLTDIDPATRSFRAFASVAMMPVTDDVWVWVTPKEEGSQVSMRSRSRKGKRDYGVNARRIRSFFSALDRHLEPLKSGE